MGGSTSSQSNQSTTTTNYNVQGNEGTAVIGDGNVTNITDGGAFLFADNTVQGLYETIQGMQRDNAAFQTENLAAVADQSKAAMDVAERASRSDQTAAIDNLAKYATAAVVVAVIAWAATRPKGKK